MSTLAPRSAALRCPAARPRSLAPLLPRRSTARSTALVAAAAARRPPRPAGDACQQPDSSDARQQPDSSKPRRGRSLPARLLAGCASLLPASLLAALPARALDDAAYLDTDGALAQSPEVLDTLVIILVTYFTVMLLYLWLSSFLDDKGEEGGAGEQGAAGLGERGPQFLDAHVRSFVDPSGPDGRLVNTPLRQLGDAAPLAGESLTAFKQRVAGGAVEALEQQLVEAERLVRSKLLARSLGYGPSRAGPAGDAGAAGAPAAQRHGDAAGALLADAALHQPGGLTSWQHKAGVEALIDEQLDALLPAGGGRYQDELVVRQVMRRLTPHLAAEEALLLLEGTQQGKQALEAGGRAGGGSKWALW